MLYSVFPKRLYVYLQMSDQPSLFKAYGTLKAVTNCIKNSP